MQLEAKMKQRFSWTAVLLLLVVRLVHSSLPPCESGIMGTFKQDKELVSLTITPFKETHLTITNEDTSSKGLQILMTLDQDAMTMTNCQSGHFTITGKETSQTCKVQFSVKDDKLTVKNPVAFSYDDPYQASFGFQGVDGLVVQGSSGEEDKIDDCKFEITDTFALDFPKFADGDNECAIQFELKGKYNATSMTVDREACKPEDPGSSADESPGQAETSTQSPGGAATTTEDKMATWWIVIGVGGGLLLLIVVIAILVIIYCFCCMKKKDSADEDVEAAPEDESDIQPTDSTVTGQGAEQPGVEPTQQNPDDKSEDKSEDKPEDKPEEKPAEE